MQQWSLVAEYMALIILIIIFARFYHFEKKVALTPIRKYYLTCVAVSIFSILLNIVCVYLMTYAQYIPLWILNLLNCLYFPTTVLMCSMFAMYLFSRLLEHVYDKHDLRRAFIYVTIITAIYFIFSIINIFANVFFYFDENHTYHRGPLNALGYGIMVVELVLLFTCYFHNKKSISPPMRHLVRSLPPVMILLTIFQFIYPDILMNGSISAITNLLIVITFQSRSVDRDSLTGIANRSNLFTELTLKTEGKQKIFSMFIYIHDYADINRKYGHAIGDALLYEIAQYLDKFSPEGKAFRYGNITFALILPWTTDEEAHHLAQTIHTRLNKPWQLGPNRISVQCTLSCLPYTQEELNGTQIVENLEYALRIARDNEKPIVFFDTAVQQQMKRNKYLKTTMLASIRDKRFKVWYQPQYCCLKNAYSSAEALLRLTDFNGEYISPAYFIPVAEEMGIIDELTWIVFDEVCTLLRAADKNGPEYISINLSLQSFADPELAEKIIAYLDHYKILPSRIRLEITESILLHEMRHAITQMEKLVTAGIQIHIDDFGTGYSNFSFVLDAPFEKIKIDRSLVQNILNDKKQKMTIQTLIHLFHAIGKKVIVEGVETKEQADLVKLYGADMIQGFYYEKPMDANSYISFLEQQ